MDSYEEPWPPWAREESKVSALIGKELVSVTRHSSLGNPDRLVFITTEGERYEMLHDQDCCESVSIEDICGDLADLVGTPLVVAQERAECADDGHDLSQWTFYTFRTIKGTVTIRWYGTSNGYYSISVDFEKVLLKKEEA